ncbi:MAG: hypothetical protein IPO91_18330 [Chloroflexi bacterium]|nr:hypothetical protein [Chloroflexota bacterium]
MNSASGARTVPGSRPGAGGVSPKFDGALMMQIFLMVSSHGDRQPQF